MNPVTVGCGWLRLLVTVFYVENQQGYAGYSQTRVRVWRCMHHPVWVPALYLRGQNNCNYRNLIDL